MTAATDAAAAFPIGARVRVRDEHVQSYDQPWRGRFAKGRHGTVMPQKPVGGKIRVQWDEPETGMPYDCFWHDPQDLELVGDDA